MQATTQHAMDTIDETGAAPRKKPLARRLLRVLLGCAYVALLVEGGAYATLWWLQGTAPTWGAQRARQEQVALQSDGDEQDDPRTGNPRRGAQSQKEVRHPFLGYLSRPAGREATRQQTSLNGLGLGDPDAPCYHLGPDGVMIALTGGSVAAQLAAEGKEVLRARLARAPALAGKDLHFFFFPNAGWKQPQQLIALAYLYSIGVRPDVVINLDGFNEIALYPKSGKRNKVFPAYPRDWYARVAASTGDLALAGRLDFALERRAAAARAVLASAWRPSWTRQLAWSLEDREWSGEYDRARASLEGADEAEREDTGTTDYERTGPPRRFASDAEMFDELVAIWSRSSRQMHALCVANGAQYFHFLQPNQYMPGSKRLTALEERVAYDPESKYRPSVETAYPLLAAEGGRARAELGLDFHDLTTIYADVAESLYEDDCCHLNDRGSELLADAIVAAMRASWE
jgi:hypothetical protein